MNPNYTLPKPIVSCYQTSNGLPEFCSIVLETLARAPLVQYDRTNCRIVTLDKWEDTRICCIMLRHLGLDVANFGGYVGRPNGLKLNVTILHRALIELNQQIQDLYASIISDWLPTEEAGPQFFQKEDPNQYHIFKKEKFIRDEDTLIRFLSSRLNVFDALKCHADGQLDPKTIYIFIKKSALNRVVAKIHFNIPLIPDIPDPQAPSLCALV